MKVKKFLIWLVCLLMAGGLVMAYVQKIERDKANELKLQKMRVFLNENHESLVQELARCTRYQQNSTNGVNCPATNLAWQALAELPDCSLVLEVAKAKGLIK